MKKCAQALRGTCSIEFRPNQTCFTTIFDARRPPKVMSTHSILNLRIDTTTSNTITYKEQTIFRPPQDTTFICGIDDSASQRYWLTTAFEKFGYQTKIWGQYASDLDSFVSDACALISTYSYHRFIFFIDRHLHYPSSQCTQVSGIQLGSNLMLQLKKLGLLHRSLILLRSADDDAPLNSNLHGFISKDILSADRCLYAILPFWNNHFTS
uniref:Uncharacterized protein n=1 Tax=Aureoumbra lagunensis TaxID=44058 RepID=A0A7S3NKJ3_9STRA